MNVGSSVIRRRLRKFLALQSAAAICLPISSQMARPTQPFDPARSAVLQKVPASRLREQFIWTAGDAAARDPALQAKVRGQNDKIEPHYFRAHFALAQLPRNATLYIAGPRSAEVMLNGQPVLDAEDDGSRPKNLTVITADVASALRSGDNLIAIKEVRGHSSLHTGASPTINQVTYGEVLAVKIVPRELGVDARPILISDASWRSTLQADSRWASVGFDDAVWQPVETVGVIGSKDDFLQWNADAGLYAWPGYSGISSRLRVFPLRAVAVASETDTEASSSMLGVVRGKLSSFAMNPGATVTLDFGREISGRLRLVSGDSQSTAVRASYGESLEEADKDKSYLGSRLIVVPGNSTAFGPKSAFRYVKLTFPERTTRWKSIDTQVITYPVHYLGSFTSSDSILNRIWETASYTARLCMQEGIWDAPKRDRGRWMGDLDVTGRTISSVFGESALMEQTMEEVIGEGPVTRDVNTITGYSALWITGQANFYRHVGDIEYLRRMKARMLELLTVMDAELDGESVFTNPGKHKVFVDWSDGFSSDTPEARAATHFEFALAYKEAAYLLDELGDHEKAKLYRDQAEKMRSIAQAKLLTSSTQTFGARWQTNAMAVVSGAANAGEEQAIWSNVLSHVGESGAVVTPYYGYYILEAMADTGHRSEALAWMRTYWGGMLAEGASSFWEAYDPHWSKQDFHAHLQADGKTGYYVSLAHGWSSGPTAWLIEQVLGIKPQGAGFRDVDVKPDLAGLGWARGSVPTPHGMIRVDVAKSYLIVTLPKGVSATVAMPFATDLNGITMNGRAVSSAATSADGKLQVVLTHDGTYRFEEKSPSSRARRENHS